MTRLADLMAGLEQYEGESMTLADCLRLAAVAHVGLWRDARRTGNRVDIAWRRRIALTSCRVAREHRERGL